LRGGSVRMRPSEPVYFYVIVETSLIRFPQSGVAPQSARFQRPACQSPFKCKFDEAKFQFFAKVLDKVNKT
jgi:hypothetical protein